MKNVENFISDYKSLILKIAKEAITSSPAIGIDDLISVGEMAIIRAINSYDPGMGATLSSHINRLIRQDIYAEAAKFCGIFSVTRQIMSLACEVKKLYDSGLSDVEISKQLSLKYNRDYELDHIKSLRIAYQNKVLNNTDHLSTMSYIDEDHIMNMLCDLDTTLTEKEIIKKRILLDLPATEVANQLGISCRKFKEIEDKLKIKIEVAIREFIS